MIQNQITDESIRFKKYIINFSLLVIILLSVIFIASSFIKGRSYSNILTESTIILENNDIFGEGRDFSYYLKKSGEDIKCTFSANIAKEDIKKMNDQFLTLFTPLMQCEAFELYINDKIIAIEGDIENYNSNIWSQHYSYTIDSSLFDKEVNELKIVQYSRYMSGGLGFSFILDGYQKLNHFQNFTAVDLHEGIFGISILTFLVIILMIFLFSEKRSLYIIMLISLVFMMIGYIEYFKIDNIGFDYLIFKKIIISSTLHSAGVGTLFYRKAFKKDKHSLLLILCYSIFILIPTIFAVDMPTYKSVYTFQTFAVILIIFYWAYLSIKNYKKFTISKILLALAGISIVYTFIWNVVEITQAAYMDSVTVIILPAYLVTALTIIFIDMLELRINVETSNKKYKSAYKKSIIDGLTKLYNAEYMKELIANTETPFAFAVFDIDDFKNINDTIGHAAGDEALMKISNITSEMLREGDVLSRYGGDEFILLLKTNSLESLEIILERIRKKIEYSAMKIDNKMQRITISIGYYLVKEKEEYIDMLKKADQALYQAKRLGKNRVVSYHSIQK